VGSNLGTHKLSFLFAKISFVVNVKMQRNTSLVISQLRGKERGLKPAIVEHCKERKFKV